MRKEHVYMAFGLLCVVGSLVYAADAVPAATAAEWAKDADAAAKAAGAQAKETAASIGTAAWIGWGGLALTGLAIVRAVVPAIPGVGPLWKFAVDSAWNVAQHKKAKEAEAAQARVACAVQVAGPVLREFRATCPDQWEKLPENVRNALQTLQITG